MELQMVIRIDKRNPLFTIRNPQFFIQPQIIVTYQSNGLNFRYGWRAC